MTRPPAFWVMPIIRPSTWAGTPVIIRSGGAPSRCGQAARTRSWLPPIPPEVTTTARAVSSSSPTTSRFVLTPRGSVAGARTATRTPVTAPPSTTSSSTRRRNAKRIRPSCSSSTARRTNGSTTPGPVPHVTWKRGTELPCPPARPSPRSAQPTMGNQRIPFSCSQERFSPAAKSTYARAQARGQWSSGRSKPAVPCQSCQASSTESVMPSRRCSGESTRNSPPNDQKACPPRLARDSCSTTTHRRAALGGLGGGDQTGEAGSHDDDVGVHAASVRRPGARLGRM